MRQLGGDPVVSTQEAELQVTRINDASFVFSGVYSRLSDRLRLPGSKWRIRFSESARSEAEWLMRYSDGRPYLVRFPNGSGNLFVSAAPLQLEYNDLVQQAEIFVPMLFRMAVSSGSRKRASFTIGRDETILLDIPAPEGDQSMKIGSEPPVIPAFRARPRGMALFTGDQIDEDGVYPLQLADSTLALLAYNYDRTESGQQFLEPGALQQAFPSAKIWEEVAMAEFGQQIAERDRGIILWKWFVILALIFLALESLILRLWKPLKT